MRIVHIAWMAAILSGCSVGVEMAEPQIDLPDRYSLVAPITAPATADIEWWRNFNDPVLDRLVARALSDSLTITQAAARLSEAEAIARRDGISVTGQGEVEASSTTGGTEQRQIGLAARIGLDNKWRKRAAQQRLEAELVNETEARRAVLAELSRAYLELRYYQRLHQTREEDLRSRRVTLREVKEQLDAGAATQLDVVRAEALVVETRSQTPGIAANIIRQRNRISTLLGAPVGMLDINLDYAGLQPTPKRVADLGVPADLLRARGDIRRAELLYAAAVSSIGVAEAARYPSLSLSGLITAPLKGGSASESISAGLSVPVFNQPALAASAEAAHHSAQGAYIQWQRAVLTAIEEVENAMAALQSALRTTKETRELVALNTEALKLSRELLESGGPITVLDVLDRERALSDARAQHARSLRDQAVEYVNLRVALGEGHAVSRATEAPAEN
ncbi:efflux transporter outer membrane subunit [Actibacterium sp. XHP0104]|uniref:efflux transporter outer membrane subunit n=1 Tax=Actibacterium sp. XHP0104 TaxID=2984335 RepID=UPI0021E6F776|nr:efflux transporter outer membrane subunit [Actibacterium sp. XHP0104]MCV2881851.1 efflux transporter outer membrane subunit [Actibacterium sp. XHP0104]